MDWKLAIAKNREALAGVVATLAGMVERAASLPPEGRVPSEARRVGLSSVELVADYPTRPEAFGSGPPSPQGGGKLPRLTYRQILLILRPAEAALRRLIVIVAAVMKIQVKAKAAKGEKGSLPDFASFKCGENLGTFALIDPRRTFQPDTRWDKPEVNIPPPPRISAPGFSDPVFAAKPSGTVDDQIDAASLQRRLAIFEKALNTLPQQAKRLVRLMARRSKAPPGPRRVGPIRPGLPPGYRKHHKHPVDAILQECHLLARDLANQPP